MDETFRSRLTKLVQKSRKALRLYSNVGSLPVESGSEFAELQVREWKEVNAELLRRLAGIIEGASNKTLMSEVSTLRDYYHEEWRLSESNLHNKSLELVKSAEMGDFVRAALLCKDLVRIKARTQACQAVHHELSDVTRQTKGSLPIELSVSEVIDEPEPEIRRQAKIIPMRKR